VLANDCTTRQVQYFCFTTILNSSVEGPMVRVLHEPRSSPSRQSGFFRVQPLKPTEGEAVRRILLASKLAAILSALALAGCAGITSPTGPGNGSTPKAPSITT
jgi:hypothetical protein